MVFNVSSDESRLIEKLRRIEALFAGAATEGEREAAANALNRMSERLKEVQKEDPPIEYKFSLSDMWARKLFSALLRRYGINPYRYYRQKHTTVMARVSAKFVDETLWPEFVELNKTLRLYIDEVTNRVISEGVFTDNSEPEVVQQLIGTN
ncbi:MAG: hypothetical protein HQM10_24135 [Candidatus Riflebacteria bacterium]|nr:hypothetical protein [Candidatus Riflebacteria bacterium]